jgi:hypothetical protein
MSNSEALGELALGLLDDDPAVQRGLQLLIEGVAVADAAFVQQAESPVSLSGGLRLRVASAGVQCRRDGDRAGKMRSGSGVR